MGKVKRHAQPQECLVLELKGGIRPQVRQDHLPARVTS